MDFCELLKEYSKENTIAHMYRESSMSYQELEEKSNSIASYLLREFMHDKSPVIVYGHKDHLMLVCFFACIKTGRAYIPVDASTPLDRLYDIIKSSGTRIIFNISNTTLEMADICILDSGKIDSLLNEYEGQQLDKTYWVKGEDTHYIIYTSGSTGKPKGVKITSNCLESFVNWAKSLIETPDNMKLTFLNQAPFSFDLSVMDLYLSLYTGGTLFSIDKEMTGNLKQLFHYLYKSDINVWVSTPSFAEMCLADSSFNKDLLPKLSVFLFCGETLLNTTVQKLHERFENARVYNLYGPTEATVAVTAIEISKDLCQSDKPLPVGYVKNDCEIKIIQEVDDNRCTNAPFLVFDDKKYLLVPEGDKGEIVIGGQSVSPGYFNNDEITRKAFCSTSCEGSEKRYYKTGDEGYLIDNILYYCGRIDFQVKLNGFRIELEDIENNLMKIDFVQNAVALPLQKDGKLHYLAAAVTLNRTFEEKEFKIGLKIKEALKELLPEYMIPRKIIIKDSMPMTPNGKINRKLLLEELK